MKVYFTSAKTVGGACERGKGELGGGGGEVSKNKQKKIFCIAKEPENTEYPET